MKMVKSMLKKIVIGHPAHNQIIKNVPKTGIVTFIGIAFGIGILVYGTYIVLNATKKETL